ncbi:LysR family transcriptional regulator [Rhizobium sp. SYY.PMSO]|uniref:LysR family transcriptional regulator n=1 Tax=Rhizobium sp. SYY.PMSO TaxID=3382192 RepID=UPI0039902451
MDRIEAMKLLVTIVEKGSLSAAGRSLGVPLATVSRKVSYLEAHLKTKLLNRSNRKLTLTDAGEAYFKASRHILQQIYEAERAAAGEYVAPRGDLVVTAPIVFGRLHMVPIIVNFLDAYPEVDVRLTLGDHITNLLDEHIDAALRISLLPDSTLMATKVGEIRRVVCGSPAYFEKHGLPRRPSDLSQLPCVTFEGQSNPLSWSFGIARAPITVPVHSRFVATTAEASINAAKLGAGVTRVLSYQIEDAVRKGELVIVLEEFEPPPIPVSLVYRGGGMIPLKLRAFLDFMTPRLRALLSQIGPKRGAENHLAGEEDTLQGSETLQGRKTGKVVKISTEL